MRYEVGIAGKARAMPDAKSKQLSNPRKGVLPYPSPPNPDPLKALKTHEL